MNKLKKSLLGIIIGILAILGIATTSNAYYGVGTIVSYTANQFLADPNLYCVQRDILLTGVVNYKVISNVRIEGNVSTDHTGKQVTSRENAKLAYILSQDNGPNKEQGPVQNAIWNYIYTWMNTVGYQHAGLYVGFASPAGGYSNWIDSAANNYADSLQNQDMTDNTNTSNIKVTVYNKDGIEYMRVGPFNWTFPGTINRADVKDQNGNTISDVIYSSFNGNTESYFGANGITSGKDFYVSIPVSSGVTNITGISASTTYNVNGVNISFLDSISGTFQNLIYREPFTGTDEINKDFTYNIPTLGKLKIIKVNTDNHEVTLAGVGFKLKHNELNKYVYQNEDGTISFVENIDDATEFITDANGRLEVDKLLVGTYTAYETKNPNYGYEFSENGVEIVIDSTDDGWQLVENKQVYVKLSGYVWVDKISGKDIQRNDLYKDNDYDDSDILLDGITVRLKDRVTGETVKEGITSDGGSYLFMDVLIEKLQDYYIEFEYDGLTYTNVIPHEDRDNGSKAAENSQVRDRFNKNFSVIEGTSRDQGITKDENGNKVHDLSYNIDENAHTATLINNGQYKITANTDETTYVIREHFEYGQEEIKYINLGLYEREQPNIALIKDLDNVRIGVNGYWHTYLYSQRFVNQGEYGDGFNVGIKFGEKYSDMSYTRAIYKADYEYENENDRSKELKVFVTYRIALRNQTTTLITNVNNIVDYYDSRYQVSSVGTSIDEAGNVSGDIKYTNGTYNENYSKLTIENNTRLDPQTTKDIYVQFELSREAVISLLNDGKTLENVAEINSYSVFDTNGTVYAGVDVNSNPGNSIPGSTNTYEDDTDQSPAFKLELADARELTGKVFLDETSGELKTGEIRQGSGQYEDGEKGIQGVHITFTENTGSGKVYETDTDENGDFYISDFIPGDYTLTYTWGDETYTVQNYKGTIYDASRDQANKEWYKQDVDVRKTDAIDNYNQNQDVPKGSRQQIDEEIKNIKYNQNFTRTKMDSTTPTMGIGVEYDTTTTASSGDRYVYRSQNVDFGIVERARQDISLTKRVKTFRASLANGQLIGDVTIDENGNITGETNYITYIGPSETNNPQNGFIRLELDNELIQGTTIEVGYEIKATNNSELDYLSENYYKYGIVEGDVVTITPTGVIDYLDKEWAFDKENNEAWEVLQKDDLNGLVAEVVYNDENSSINDKVILYTNELAKPLEPTATNSVMLNVSKIITTGDDIELGNETEIVEIDKTGGSDINSTPGNYIPGLGHQENDDGMAETVIVIPSTGQNLNFIIPIAIGLVALVVLAGGVILIKKKVLKK